LFCVCDLYVLRSTFAFTLSRLRFARLFVRFFPHLLLRCVLHRSLFTCRYRYVAVYHITLRYLTFTRVHGYYCRLLPTLTLPFALLHGSTPVRSAVARFAARYRHIPWLRCYRVPRLLRLVLVRSYGFILTFVPKLPATIHYLRLHPAVLRFVYRSPDLITVTATGCVYCLRLTQLPHVSNARLPADSPDSLVTTLTVTFAYLPRFYAHYTAFFTRYFAARLVVPDLPRYHRYTARSFVAAFRYAAAYGPAHAFGSTVSRTVLRLQPAHITYTMLPVTLPHGYHTDFGRRTPAHYLPDVPPVYSAIYAPPACRGFCRYYVPFIRLWLH